METLIDRDGNLAIAFDWRKEWNIPVCTRDVLISKIPADSYSQLIGKSIEKWYGDVAIVYHNNKPFTVDTSYWNRICDEVPVIKPRKGKSAGMRYDWKWELGEWLRIWQDNSESD